MRPFNLDNGVPCIFQSEHFQQVGHDGHTRPGQKEGKGIDHSIYIWYRQLLSI